MLAKKVDALTKSIELESKRMKREAAAAKEKDAASVKADDNRKSRHANSSKRYNFVSIFLCFTQHSWYNYHLMH